MSPLPDKYAGILARLMTKTIDGELQWRLVQNPANPWAETYEADFRGRRFTVDRVPRSNQALGAVADALRSVDSLLRTDDPLPSSMRGRGLYRLTVDQSGSDDPSRVIFPPMRAVDDLGELVVSRHSSVLDELADLLK